MIAKKKASKPLLNDNQILLLRGFIRDKKISAEELIGIIDGYVTENKTATQQYKKVLATLKKNIELAELKPALPDRFQLSMSVISSMFLTEFMIYVGAVSRADIEKKMADLGISIDNGDKPNLA